MGKDITNFLGGAANTFLGGGSKGSGGSNTSSYFNFTPPQNEQGVMWATPNQATDALPNYNPFVTNPIASNYGNLFTNMMNLQNRPSWMTASNDPTQRNLLFTPTMSLDEQNAYSNLLNSYRNPYNTLQNTALQTIGANNYATLPTGQSLDMLNNARYLGQGGIGALQDLSNQVSAIGTGASRIGTGNLGNLSTDISNLSARSYNPSFGALQDLSNQVSAAGMPNATMGGVSNYLQTLMNPNYTNPLTNPIIAKQMQDLTDVEKENQQRAIDLAASEAAKYGSTQSSELYRKIGDIERAGQNDLQRNMNALYGNTQAHLLNLQQAGVPLAYQGQRLGQEQALNTFGTQKDLQNFQALMGQNAVNQARDAFNTQLQIPELQMRLGRNAQEQALNTFNTQLQIPELAMRQGQFQANLIPQLQDIWNQQGSRAGQQFNMGQNLLGNQQKQAQGLMQATGVPRSYMDTDYDRWLQQQQQAANIAHNFGSFGGQQYMTPQGYVVNKSPDTKWYEPFLHQGEANIANTAMNWLSNQLGGATGGGGTTGGGTGGNILSTLLGASGLGGAGSTAATQGNILDLLVNSNPITAGIAGNPIGITGSPATAGTAATAANAVNPFALSQILPALGGMGAFMTAAPFIQDALGSISNAIFGGGQATTTATNGATVTYDGMHWTDAQGNQYTANPNSPDTIVPTNYNINTNPAPPWTTF